MKSKTLCIFALACAATRLYAEAPFTIVVIDPPGVGFNDPTPAEPVGGNSGATLGEQRLIAFQYGVSIWSSKLESTAPIRVRASFGPLYCTEQSGHLGVSSVIQAFRYTDTGTEFHPNIWYPSALANKLAEKWLDPNDEDIEIQFNSDIGRPNCIARLSWYYGLDNRANTNQADIVTTLLHELAHGFGFGRVFARPDYSKFRGAGDVYSHYLLDLSTGKTWNEMSNEERLVSAVNTRQVVWNGINVRNDAPKVLKRGGDPTLSITAPKSLARNYYLETAAFGSRVGTPAVSGRVVLALDEANSGGPLTTDACSTLLNSSALVGQIAMADRGTCAFVQKAQNVQAAGATALIVVNNLDIMPTPLLGTGPEISIPVIHISLSDGRKLKGALAAFETVTAELGADPDALAGADDLGRPFLFAPNPIKEGSTMTHWDRGVTPNQLMEPNVEEDLTYNVEAPHDLTLAVLKDLGWLADSDGVPDGIDQCPGSDRGASLVVQGCDTGVNNVTFSTGCRISDFLKPCEDPKNARSYGACVALVSRDMVNWGVINAQDHGKIQSCLVQPQPGVTGQ